MLTLFLALICVVIGVAWVFAGMKPLLVVNYGSIITPMILAILIQFFAFLETSTTLFALLTGILIANYLLAILIGWQSQLFFIYLIPMGILFIGNLLDAMRFRRMGLNSYFFLAFALIVGIIATSIYVATL